MYTSAAYLHSTNDTKKPNIFAQNFPMFTLFSINIHMLLLSGISSKGCVLNCRRRREGGNVEFFELEMDQKFDVGREIINKVRFLERKNDSEIFCLISCELVIK
jgi:hypothetical protein